MKPFSLLIKPASADCNLRCEYCFYFDHSALYPETKVHRMSDAVLEKMIAGYMATSQPTYAFGWQGGEPTLMGLDFFKKVTDLQKKYGRSGMSVANGLQTNAVLITDEMARHLAEYNFLLGVSLDGPEDIHDRYRINAAGKGSHADVLRAIERLQRNKVEFNILVLVSAANVHRAREVYRYLRARGFNYLQFIPCVEFDTDGKLHPFAITGEQWGTFLCDLYDEWHVSDTRTISIRFFDSLMTRLVDNTCTICHMDRLCCQYFVVEHNGDIYPCDFFVEKDLKLGNVTESSWETVQKSTLYRQFGEKKTQWNNECASCEYLYICSGDCLKHRIYNAHAPETLSWLCSGWRQFYDHALPGMLKLADQIRRERQSVQPPKQATAPQPAIASAPGRNDPCPCGSGRKYKKCCAK